MKIIAESYGFDFTSIDSLQTGFNRPHRFTKSKLKTGIICNREFRLICYELFVLSSLLLCWPFLFVSATTMTALLSPFGEGQGMGIFCGLLAMACVTGSALGGWLAAHWGYKAVPGMAVVTETLGLVITYKIMRTRWIVLDQKEPSLAHTKDIIY